MPRSGPWQEPWRRGRTLAILSLSTLRRGTLPREGKLHRPLHLTCQQGRQVWRRGNISMVILLRKGTRMKTSPGPGPGRSSLCLAGDEQDDVKSTWAGPWPPAAPHAHLGRTEACKPGLPGHNLEWLRVSPSRQDLLLHQVCQPLFLDHSEGRIRAEGGVPCPSEGVGRGHGQGTPLLGEREKKACCLPGS